VGAALGDRDPQRRERLDAADGGGDSGERLPPVDPAQRSSLLVSGDQRVRRDRVDDAGGRRRAIGREPFAERRDHRDVVGGVAAGHGHAPRQRLQDRLYGRRIDPEVEVVGIERVGRHLPGRVATLDDDPPDPRDDRRVALEHLCHVRGGSEDDERDRALRRTDGGDQRARGVSLGGGHRAPRRRVRLHGPLDDPVQEHAHGLGEVVRPQAVAVGRRHSRHADLREHAARVARAVARGGDGDRHRPKIDEPDPSGRGEVGQRGRVIEVHVGVDDHGRGLGGGRGRVSAAPPPARIATATPTERTRLTVNTSHDRRVQRHIPQLRDRDFRKWAFHHLRAASANRFRKPVWLVSRPVSCAPCRAPRPA
jgi:hypothetical protein